MCRGFFYGQGLHCLGLFKVLQLFRAQLHIARLQAVPKLAPADPLGMQAFIPNRLLAAGIFGGALPAGRQAGQMPCAFQTGAGRPSYLRSRCLATISGAMNGSMPQENAGRKPAKSNHEHKIFLLPGVLDQ